MPGESGCNRGDYARVVFVFTPREAAGAAGTRHSLRPHFRGEGFLHDSDAIAPREYFCHARTPVPDLIGDDPGIHQFSQGFFRRRWITGSPSAKTRFALLPGDDDLENRLASWLFDILNRRAAISGSPTIAVAFRSLPPCGGALGRGWPHRDCPCGPLSPTSRASFARLGPHKGGGSSPKLWKQRCFIKLLHPSRSAQRRSSRLTSRSARYPSSGRAAALLLPFLLLGAVAAVEAAGGRAQYAMVASIVTGDAADGCAFQAALGVGG
jgi:hypothetical protein